MPFRKPVPTLPSPVKKYQQQGKKIRLKQNSSFISTIPASAPNQKHGEGTMIRFVIIK